MSDLHSKFATPTPHASGAGHDGEMLFSPRRRKARPKLNAKQRARLIAKSEGHCIYCGYDSIYLGMPMEIDHFIPLSRGGSNRQANLVAACQSCNAEKGNMLPEEYRAYLMAMPPAWSFVLFDYENGCYGPELGIITEEELERVLSRNEAMEEYERQNRERGHEVQL